MKILFLLFLIKYIIPTIQHTKFNPNEKIIFTNELKFNSTLGFRVLQITDGHYGEDCKYNLYIFKKYIRHI